MNFLLSGKTLISKEPHSYDMTEFLTPLWADDELPIICLEVPIFSP